MQRVIFLVDMNAFFISCEAARNPQLKEKPAAVAGDPKNRSGIILTANYNARKFGVKTTMVIYEAKKLCPDIILVPPDHDFYEKKSQEVMDILSSYTPTLEQNSIDEAWLDLTGCEGLFGKPLDIAKKIMENIQNELDLWCSIGISENKFLAKMASDLKKPQGISELWKEDIKAKLWPLPVKEMYGIGKQTAEKLAKIGIFNIGDIANYNKNLLIKHFGKYGSELYNLSNGIDTSSVCGQNNAICKSISRSTTLSADTTDFEHAQAVLLSLSEEVGFSARKQDFKGKTVSIVLKYSDFSSITRQKSISPTYLTKAIYATGTSLLSENWNAHRPVRLIGIGLSNVDDKCSEQLSLFDLIEDKSKDKKEESIERTMDKLREKFGPDKIKRAKALDS